MAKAEVNEQVKPIIIHDGENQIDYTLEFNRETIRFAEARGFDIDDVGKYPMSKLPELFYYAFRMHHKNVSREKTDRIRSCLTIWAVCRVAWLKGLVRFTLLRLKH